MKDYFGRELKVGDLVVHTYTYSGSNGVNHSLGIITKFSEKRVGINGGSCSLHPHRVIGIYGLEELAEEAS